MSNHSEKSSSPKHMRARIPSSNREHDGRDVTSFQNFPQEGAAYGGIRFGEVKEVYVEWDPPPLAKLMYLANDERHVNN